MLIQKDTKHRFLERPLLDRFESFANSERYKTTDTPFSSVNGLRALLIQKDTKLLHVFPSKHVSLRALLIQKDTKLYARKWMGA